MSLPPSSLSVPTLSADQLYFQGVTIGGSTPFQIKELDGLDKPNVRSGNTSRPRFRGSYVGLNLLDTRKITLTMDAGSPFGGYTNLPGALSALAVACNNEGTTEYPLWLQVKNFTFVCTMCRVIKKTANYDLTADLGNLLQNISLQWESTDPAFYGAPTTNNSGGLGGSALLGNTGDLPCYPVTTITGPCTNPTVTNTSITGSPSLAFTVTIAAGDTLVIDHDLQSVTYTVSGTPSNGLYLLNPGSTFWVLPANTTSSITSSGSGGGMIGIDYASAYSALT